LAVVEERAVTLLGSVIPIPLDVRIISAINKNVREELRDKRLREDLYFCLCEFDIWILFFRERQEDILFLAQRFFSEVVVELQKRTKSISLAAATLLKVHHWDGNVRELKNTIRKAVLLCKSDQLMPEDIPIFPNLKIHITGMMQEKNRSFPDTLQIMELEKWAIQQALIKTEGKHMKAAEMIGIGYQKFKRKLLKYELQL
jgi:DNA-binding NtrC family response regulator